MLPKEIMLWEETSDYADQRYKGYKSANDFNINPSAEPQNPNQP